MSKRKPLPPQPELQRRLRAARVLMDVSFVELAERLPEEATIGERVLRNLEGGTQQLKPQILRELAVAIGVPYAWFTVDDVFAHLTKDVVDIRLAQLERDFNTRLAELEARIARNSNGQEAAQTETTASSPQPVRARRAPRSSRPSHER
jgi:transcriptional regulator with XRE-family HTH domain